MKGLAVAPYHLIEPIDDRQGHPGGGPALACIDPVFAQPIRMNQQSADEVGEPIDIRRQIGHRRPVMRRI